MIFDRKIVTVKKSQYKRSLQSSGSILIYGEDSLMDVASYNPTSKAKNLFVTVKSSGGFFSGGSWKELCFGHYEVSNIAFISAPANFGGMKVAEVKYRVSVTPLNWMKQLLDFGDLSWKKEEFSKVFERINNKIRNEEIKKITLIATTKGWIIDE